MKEYISSRNGNIVTIEAPEAKYTIIYGIHIRGQKVEHLPEDLDGLFLETGMFGWYDDPAACLKSLKSHVQYRPIFETLENRRIPILLGDLKYKYDDHVLLLADNASSTIQWIAGIKMFQNMFAGRKPTERKRSPGEWLIYAGLAGWMLIPFSANMLHLASTFIGKGESQTASLKKFSHRLHPEADLLYLSLRNAVIAEKLVYFAKSFKTRPHLGIILGAGHVGVEDMLTASTEKRMIYLRNFKDLLKKLARQDYLTNLLTVIYKGNTWEDERLITIPTLQQIYQV